MTIKTEAEIAHEKEVERLLAIAVAKVAYSSDVYNAWDSGSSAVAAYVKKALDDRRASNKFVDEIIEIVRRAMVVQHKYCRRSQNSAAAGK